jgi:hypothetical protein
METPENQSRKYTAIAIVILGSLLLLGMIGLFVTLITQSPAPMQSEDTSLVTRTIPGESTRDEIIAIPTLEPTPTEAEITVRSTRIIAPLLSFDERINSGEQLNYMFQAVANTPLIITLETSYDLQLQFHITDRHDTVIYEDILDRGLHEITFDPTLSGEYRIHVKSIEGQGEYTIRMDFDIEQEPQL